MKIVLMMLVCIEVSCVTSVPSDNETWLPSNRVRIYKFLNEADAVANAAAVRRKVAVFDWDNTLIKNDIGDAFTVEFVKIGKIKTPQSWASTSRHLTKSALESLNKNCPIKSGVFPARMSNCQTAILCIYLQGKVWDGVGQPGSADERCSGDKGFALQRGSSEDLLEPGYAWAVALQAGYTPDEIRAFAKDVFNIYAGTVLGTTHRVGFLTGMSRFIRVYAPMNSLIDDLSARGFEIWVSTASHQFVVDTVATDAFGINPEHVIGVRTVLEDGRITTKFQGCGNYPESQDLINYRLGKRCWINKVIFEYSESRQMTDSSPILFAAGDSDTDAFFLRDAIGLRVVLNRNKREIMCNALENADGNWVVQPMFIDPKPIRTEPYQCDDFINVLNSKIPSQREGAGGSDTNGLSGP